jgi:hypothetical protein
MPKAGKLLVALAAILMLALPASAAAKVGGKPVDRLAAQACANERGEKGKAAFRKKYGERATMRACVRRTRHRARAALRNATDQCLAELAEIGPEEFADEYGTDETGSDAFQQCVDWTAEWILEPEDDDEDFGEDEEDAAGEEE